MTTDTNRLIIQFTENAINAKTAAQIREVLDGMGAGAGERIADHIAIFCERRGIDPKAPELMQYYRETTEYKKQQSEAEASTKADNAAATLSNILTTYKDNRGRGVSPGEKEMRELSKEIRKQSASLEVAPDKSDRIGTWADYIHDCITYEPDKDFTPALFGGLAFPNGTLSYIGARTSRGKTTALINLAREAVTGKTPRRTIYITLEESRKQLLNKLILSTAYAMATTENSGIDIELLNSRPRPNVDLYHIIKGREIGETGAGEIVRYINSAMKTIEDAYTTKTLMIYDGRGARLDEITGAITAHAGPGVLVLLDYIQRMPDHPDAPAKDFYRMKKISDEVVSAAVESSSIIISGAQFNRTASGGKSKTPGGADNFDDTSFRESGDIEQDAHNAIGLGWEADKKNRFIEILKTREDTGAGTQYKIDFVGAYRYMACKKEPRHTKKDTDKGNNNTRKDKKDKVLEV